MMYTPIAKKAARLAMLQEVDKFHRYQYSFMGTLARVYLHELGGLMGEW